MKLQDFCMLKCSDYWSGGNLTEACVSSEDKNVCNDLSERL